MPLFLLFTFVCLSFFFSVLCVYECFCSRNILLSYTFLKVFVCCFIFNPLMCSDKVLSILFCFPSSPSFFSSLLLPVCLRIYLFSLFCYISFFGLFLFSFQSLCDVNAMIVCPFFKLYILYFQIIYSLFLNYIYLSSQLYMVYICNIQY